MKLNGWQRMWVFSSILIGCVSMGIGIAVFPTSGWAETQFRERLAELDADKLKVESPTYIPAKKPDRWNRYADEAGRTPISLATIQQARTTVTVKHAKYLVEVREKQTDVLLAMFAVWAGLSGILYLVGWFIAWIVRGFKADKAAKTNS